jgi:hypothetical protein
MRSRRSVYLFPIESKNLNLNPVFLSRDDRKFTLGSDQSADLVPELLPLCRGDPMAASYGTRE